MITSLSKKAFGLLCLLAALHFIPSQEKKPKAITDCPRFSLLPRLCVPTPDSDKEVIEVDPKEDCQGGYFSVSDVDVRKLFNDTILIKEKKDPSGERPVLALFLGQSKALLFDTGNRSIPTQEIITPLLQGRPVEVLNSHLHGDHIGQNKPFSVIAIETKEVDAHCRIKDFDDNQSAQCQNDAPYTPPDEQALFANQSFQVVKVIRGGHRIDLGDGRSLEVLFTPGHSKTSVTLLDKSHRLLFTGDTLYPGGEPPLIHPQIGSSFDEYLETATRYAALSPQIDVVIGAHGEGLMPPRVLEEFFGLVRLRFEEKESADLVDDPEGCPSGDFIIGNDPARP